MPPFLFLKMVNKEWNLSDKMFNKVKGRYTGKESGFLTNRDVKEFIRRLKKLPNSDGGTNCECIDGSMIKGGKGYTCEFCIGLLKLAGSSLVDKKK